MTQPGEFQYGSAREYSVTPRSSNPGGITFKFSEKFFESNDRQYDAILLLGCRQNHDYVTPRQDITNSVLWRGFSKKARAISRLFVKEIACTYSIPNFRNLMDVGPDYTGRLATVGTVDNGRDNMPDLASEGVLAELRTITGYSYLFEEQGTDDTVLDRSWTHQRYSPLNWVYEDLEVTLPLSFYHKSIGFGDENKPAWVFWKIICGIRFHASTKANPRYTKGIEVGGVSG